MNHGNCGVCDGPADFGVCMRCLDEDRSNLHAAESRALAAEAEATRLRAEVEHLGALLASPPALEAAEREIATLRADLAVAESRKSGVIRGLVEEKDAALGLCATAREERDEARGRLERATRFHFDEGEIGHSTIPDYYFLTLWGADEKSDETTYHATLDAAWGALESARKEGGK